MKLHFTIIFTSVLFTINAQKSEIKFGKVSMEEVAQKTHSIDNEAEAAILYKKERLVYDYHSEKGFMNRRKVHLRIKIYNKSGLDWATKKISLYTSNSGKQKADVIKGYTFNLEGNKIVESKLKKESIFSENISAYRNQISITMPNVKVGSVIDLEYEISSDLVGYMDDYRLQYGIPLDFVELNIDVPEYFNFKRFTRGFYPISLQESTNNRSVPYSYKVQNRQGLASVGSNSTTRNGSLDFSEKRYEVSAKNIPALKEVDFTDNIENYRSALIFELESTKFPNSGFKIYSQSWEDVANTIYKYDDFGGEIGKNRNFKDDLDLLIKENKDTRKLASTIYKFVQDRMTWDDYNGVGCKNGIKKAYDQKSGNVADINLMLTSMFRYAGLNANPVLVSTKANGIPLFPTTNGFNYVVAAIENGDDYILFDATEKMLAENDLPNRAMNWSGRLVREDGTSKQIPLVPKAISSKLVFMNARILEDGSLEGEMKTRLTNNLAFDYRVDNISRTKEEILEVESTRHSSIEINDFELKNQMEPVEPLEHSITFIKENQVEIIGSTLYFNPLIFFALKENPFKLDAREYPVDFNYPFSKKLIINYVIPDGYKIESIPDNLRLGLPDELGVFNFVMQQNGNSLQVVCTSEINEAIIPAYYYSALKEFYNKMVQKQNEKVVLSRI